MLNLINKMEFGHDNMMWIAEILPTFNQSKEDRISIAHLSSICKGHFHSVNAEKRFNMLMQEGPNNTPTTPIEFIPVSLDRELIVKLLFGKYNMLDMANYIDRHSFLIMKRTSIYNNTNIRTLCKAGIKLEDIPFNTSKDVKNFKIIIGFLSHYCWMHLRTHRAFSFLIETGRKSVMSELYYPTKDKHYANKKEITRLRLGVFGGWANDPETWDNLIATRSSRDTQEDTKEIVKQIKSLIYD